ncbi:flagellar brake protein [Thauera sinica]|uniref:Flagellar brake protein YcgR n=1 Tax=Thauera sinica TaxID=2665146 RepID=A0ABW1APF4_9RHOO|nr:flagellar brake protein [Thauera sp. K11]ATE59431.1 flagellar brake protein [Thauera sp. K11]
MATDNNQTRVELLHADDESRFLLRDPREIAHLIRELSDERTLVTAHLAPGNQSFLTLVLGLTPGEDTLLLDGSTAEAINRQIEHAEQITCITQLDKVRVQFSLGRPSRSDAGSGPVFSAPLPAEILRLQRRDFFRLSTPVTHTVVCSIPLGAGRGKGGRVDMRILDISTGGIAIAVPPTGIAFEPGMSFAGCRLELPDSEPIPAHLTVRNLFRLVTRNGVEMLRAGCQFSGLPAQAENVIQRYIMKNERQRAARARGRR